MELAQRSGCYLWHERYLPGAIVTWTGECTGGVVHGSDTIAWSWNENRQRTGTGRLQGGKQNGHWVMRLTNGTVLEGPFVDGSLNGHWVVRFPNGRVEEGPTVDGVRKGHWVIRYPNGSIWQEGSYVNGERHGHWIIRERDGSVRTEGPYVNGEQRDQRWIRNRAGDGAGSPPPADRLAGSAVVESSFGPDSTCSDRGDEVEAPRWQEISERPRCYVLNTSRLPGSLYVDHQVTIAWDGECSGGLAEGQSTLTKTLALYPGLSRAETGRLRGGVAEGHWIWRYSDGNTSKVP